MGSAFHQLCPRYSGTLTPTAPTAIKLWDTFTFTFIHVVSILYICLIRILALRSPVLQFQLPALLLVCVLFVLFFVVRSCFLW